MPLNFNNPLVPQYQELLTDGNTTLNLSYQNLGDQTGEVLAFAFSLIPEGVTRLDLSGNNLWRLNGAQLAIAFAALPSWVKILDLSSNRLGDKLHRGIKLSVGFRAIPLSVTTLILRGNRLAFYNIVSDQLFYSSISAGVTNLDLSANYYVEEPTSHSGLDKVTRANHRYWRDYDVALLSLKDLPRTVVSLSLDYNMLGYEAAGTMEAFFQDLAPGITTVSLTNNHFETQDPTCFYTMFQSFPQRVTTLNLSGNSFNFKSRKDKILFLSSIPPTVTQLIADDFDVLEQVRTQAFNTTSIVTQLPLDLLGMIMNYAIESSDFWNDANPSRFLSYMIFLSAVIRTTLFSWATAAVPKTSKIGFWYHTARLVDADPSLNELILR